MTIVRDENRSIDALAIVEKYEAFVHYLYPIVQRSPKHHGVLRDAVMAELFAPTGDLYHAAKSKQVSRLYAIDARFATLRSYLQLGLRFSKWSVAPAHRGVNFLGYRIWATHKLLRRDSVIRARRKIAAFRAAGDGEGLGMFLAAWLGHARWADSANLIRSLEIQA